MNTLQQQTILITGAAQGLGRAIATAFYQTGANIALLDRDEQQLESLVVSLRAGGSGGRVLPVVVDLADADATQGAAQRVLAEFTRVDTLVHNAAVLIPEAFELVSFERWQATVNVGIQAAFLLTKAVWAGMKAQGGCIVFVSSRSGIEGFADESAYCASKHALEGFMKSLALEGKAHDIRVHTITPGMYMRTPMSERNYPEELKQQWVDPIALTPAFLKLAARGQPDYSGQRLNAWELSQKE